MTEISSVVNVRLSPDAMYLDLLLTESAASMALPELAALIQERCVQLGVPFAFTPHELSEQAQRWTPHEWHRLASGRPPSPPVHEQIEFLVATPPVATSARTSGATTVELGTPLVRLVPGVPGQPGQDLLGREVPAYLPRAARLPRGENTCLSDDGRVLLAARRGEVVFRGLQLHVLTMRTHDGDYTAAHGPLHSEIGVRITGSVGPGACIDIVGDVQVEGGVLAAEITSREGSIAVKGELRGTVQRPASICAGRNVICHTIRHAEVMAAGDLYLRHIAWSSTLNVIGDLHLGGPLASSLVDVAVRVGGAMVLPINGLPTAAAPVHERQHSRVNLTLSASVALHGTSPVAFVGAVVEDISVGGARFTIAGRDASLSQVKPGSILQLKCELPDEQGQMLALARVARAIAPDTFGLSFVQLTQRDRTRLTTLCRQRILARQQVVLGHANDRQHHMTEPENRQTAHR